MSEPENPELERRLAALEKGSARAPAAAPRWRCAGSRGGGATPGTLRRHLCSSRTLRWARHVARLGC